MSDKSKKQKTGHEEVANTPFTADYTIKRIKLPAKINSIPQIIGWSGPARSGTTGLLYLLAGHTDVDRVYFQPLKTLLRKGTPDFNLNLGDSLVCMKEVFRGCCPANSHDPIDMLLKAGVPPHKITWITILRDPAQNYASWAKSFEGVTPQTYAAAQEYSIDRFNYYKNRGVRMTPFTYDLLADGEYKVINTLLQKVGLAPFNDPQLKFSQDAITKKMQYGQGADSSYFDSLLKKTIERKKFMYAKNNAEVPADVLERVINTCQARYDAFYELSRRELGL